MRRDRILKVPVLVEPQGENALVMAANGVAMPSGRLLGRAGNFGHITGGSYHINTAHVTVLTSDTTRLHGMNPEQPQLHSVDPAEVDIVTTLCNP